MKARTFFSAFLPALLLQAAPGHAQEPPPTPRTWVSGVGDNASLCTRDEPCRTFDRAMARTLAGGEIGVLDGGGFGAVTITKSLSIVSERGEAGVLAPNGIIINAGSSDVIILRGLVVDGTGGAGGQNGITFNSGRSLHIQNTLIKNFTGGAPNGFGIDFAPTTFAELFVSDTAVINSGNIAATSGAGINIEPSGAVGVNVTLNRVQIENNRNGLRANSQSMTSGGIINVAMVNSSSVGNTFNGVAAVSAANNGIPVNVIVANSVVAQNANAAFNANGGATKIRVGNSLLTGNAMVVSITNNGGVLSYQDNRVVGNGDDTMPATTAALN